MSNSPPSTDLVKSQMQAAEHRIARNIQTLSDDLEELGTKIRQTRASMGWPKTKMRQIRQWTDGFFTSEVRSVVYPAAALAGAFAFINIWQRRYPQRQRASIFSTSKQGEIY